MMGPKGAGKTTLIDLTSKRLREVGKVVEIWTEKELMAAVCGPELEAAYFGAKLHPGITSDTALAALHRAGRVRISDSSLRDAKAEIVLLDRWYPSDVVFRRYIDVQVVVEANIEAGVRVPDVAFAVTCNAAISWKRARGRERGLDSKIIRSKRDHVESTERFERAATAHGWLVVRSDHASADEMSRAVANCILAQLDKDT